MEGCGGDEGDERAQPRSEATMMIRKAAEMEKREERRNDGIRGRAIMIQKRRWGWRGMVGRESRKQRGGHLVEQQGAEKRGRLAWGFWSGRSVGKGWCGEDGAGGCGRGNEWNMEAWNERISRL